MFARWGFYLDVEVSYVEGMQKSNSVQNLLQQSDDLPLLRNFVPVEYHLQFAVRSPVAINIKPFLSPFRAVFMLSARIISRDRPSPVQTHSNKSSTLFRTGGSTRP